MFRPVLISLSLSLSVVLLTTLSILAPASAQPLAARPPDLGPNVLVFDPGMPLDQIQAAVDAVAAQQVDSEMGTGRFTLLFKPGVYGSAAAPLTFQVGYYTEVAGLGASPGDVVINGHVDVYNRCLTPDNCIALVNFWRSLSNLTVNLTGLSGCRAAAGFWAVSQAAPMRRVDFTGGSLTLFDFCTAGPQFSSGGFIADSRTGFVINGSQQQFLVRDSSIGGWSNGVWNQVFSGVIGAPPQSFGSTPFNPPPYTTLATSPVSRERPFLYVDAAGRFQVFVPALRRDAVGTTWASGAAPGTSVPLHAFFVARPTDRAQVINAALAEGKHLIFTPGIYHLDHTLRVEHRDTLVLGLGFATLVPDRGIPVMTVADVPGVALAGLLIDAGPESSPVLVRIGDRDRRDRDRDDYDHDRDDRDRDRDRDDHGRHRDADDPTALHDVFFRIGGATPGQARRSLVVNRDDVLLDNIWAWRADHGTGVGWTVNQADTGVVVNGDGVTAFGLFVEHYQKFNVVWNGEDGRTIMFQNELPYDPPSEAAWSHDGVVGFAAYKVSDAVHSHEAWGLGSYSNFIAGPEIHAARAFEAPRTPGVKLHDLLSVFLNAHGGIDHVIDDVGAPVNSSNQVTNIVSFP
ncbi:MAG TPA: coagulation factor 5/8 type domain-containing protein [Kofleriaceae bacterium]|nr:coagulation factor 5/8 type domain-containing protein [Kofleriaceae bacterium]